MLFSQEAWEAERDVSMFMTEEKAAMKENMKAAKARRLKIKRLANRAGGERSFEKAISGAVAIGMA